MRGTISAPPPGHEASMEGRTREARTDVVTISPKPAGGGVTASGLLTILEGYNLKNRNPGDVMTESDGSHYRCPWIEDSITVHSDGNVSCGLDDPHSQRSFGNVKESRVEEIFRNPAYTHLQNKLWRGHRCRGCGLYRRTGADRDPAAEARMRLPRSLVVETTVKCNLRCPNTACIPNNDSNEKTRDVEFLDLETVKSVADQLATSLETIHFYNYGEPFLNRQADDMLLYLRAKCPGALIVTSTNGIPLSNPARAEKVVRAEPDRIIFSISGITQEVYGRYHVAGKCEQMLAALKNVCEARRRLGQTRTMVLVRYLVFHWNDSDEQIDAAIALAKEYGVDRFSLYLTDEPPGSRSARFSPGSPSYFKYKKYIHFDHLERLDHIYHCELPDKDGLYRWEEMPDFGLVRRTGSEATLRRGGRNGRLRLSIAVDQPRSRERELSCLVQTPWETYRVPLVYGQWRPMPIRVPREYRRSGPVEIKVSTEDHWYPAQDYGNDDLRCLGVLIRSEPLIGIGWSARRRRILKAMARARRPWRRISRTAVGRFLSSLPGRLRPIGSGQAPPRAGEGWPDSPEVRRHRESMARLYRTFFNRAPDPAGLKGWMDALLDNSGRWSLIQVAHYFVASEEFREVYGADPSPEVFAAAACRNALGHEPDPADFRRWVDYLTAHGNGKPARAATGLGIAEEMVRLDGPAGASRLRAAGDARPAQRPDGAHAPIGRSPRTSPRRPARPRPSPAAGDRR